MLTREQELRTGYPKPWCIACAHYRQFERQCLKERIEIYENGIGCNTYWPFDLKDEQ